MVTDPHSATIGLLGERALPAGPIVRLDHTELGRSPREFVDDIRLERATHLLRTTALTVDTAAAKAGYLNGGTLRNLVRRRRGMSTAEFRSAGPMW